MRHAPHAVFRKISQVHNNGKTLLFIEVKYYVCQMDRLLDAGLRNVLVKWRSADCPYYKLLLASTRKIDNRGSGSLKRTEAEGLDGGNLEVDDDEGKCLLYFTSPFPENHSIT